MYFSGLALDGLSFTHEHLVSLLVPLLSEGPLSKFLQQKKASLEWAGPRSFERNLKLENTEMMSEV